MSSRLNSSPEFSPLAIRSSSSEAVRKGGQAPYILHQIEARATTSGSQSPFPDSQLVLVIDGIRSYEFP